MYENNLGSLCPKVKPIFSVRKGFAKSVNIVPHHRKPNVACLRIIKKTSDLDKAADWSPYMPMGLDMAQILKDRFNFASQGVEGMSKVITEKLHGYIGNGYVTGARLSRDLEDHNVWVLSIYKWTFSKPCFSTRLTSDIINHMV